MKTVYEALNIVEAHMLADLLKQEGYSVQIQGEHLIGAIGELPAAGLIRLTVDEAEYDAVRAFIHQWEATQPKETPQMKPKSRNSRIWFAAIGVLIGIAVTYLFFQLPYNSASFDHNNDNFADDSWIYSPGGRLVKFEADRNFDRKIDEYTEYDTHSLPTFTWQDNDFNGTFETRTTFHNNAADRMLSDTDGDGFIDVMIVYLNGLTHSVEYIDPKTKSPWRIEYFRLGIFLTHADVDKNKDGRLESRQWYGMVKSSVWNQFRTKSPIMKLPVKMATPRKFLIILMGSLGAGLFLYGLVVWFETGCDFNNLWFSKNTFGTHPLHISVLGLLTMGYSAIDFCFAIFSRRS